MSAQTISRGAALPDLPAGVGWDRVAGLSLSFTATVGSPMPKGCTTNGCKGSLVYKRPCATSF
ncbi:hypothetical protein [Bifidobacterium aemilianum]|uniref:hypothetical protein n=1 Tax=Bifidobacterium aemilianum TaxID=2493120 RepID=UPI000FDCFB37|nr:hypothetical protein [Bifidobacterium aemilianum]